MVFSLKLTLVWSISLVGDKMSQLNPMELMTLRLALRSDVIRLEALSKSNISARDAYEYELRKRKASDLLELLAPGVKVTVERVTEWQPKV